MEDGDDFIESNRGEFVGRWYTHVHSSYLDGIGTCPKAVRLEDCGPLACVTQTETGYTDFWFPLREPVPVGEPAWNVEVLPAGCLGIVHAMDCPYCFGQSD